MILAAGRLAEKNRFATLIRAIGTARTLIPNLRCYILGRGHQLDLLRALAAKLGCQAAVTLVGYVSDADLGAYLRSADLVVATAGGNEGFGLFVSEALACGVPVIATDRGGHVDLIREDANGWFFNGSVEGLVSALLRAHAELALEPRDVRCARTRSTVESLTWERHCGQLERLIADVVPVGARAAAGGQGAAGLDSGTPRMTTDAFSNTTTPG
ncbi:MAG: glycosyltransferase [Actinobacteria bacterium]|nr:glycosyltransferase [Actinomycetota bacterium]